MDDKFILNCNRGYKIPLIKRPKQNKFKQRKITDRKEKNSIQKAVNDLLQKSAIIESKNGKLELTKDKKQVN